LLLGTLWLVSDCGLFRDQSTRNGEAGFYHPLSYRNNSSALIVADAMYKRFLIYLF